MTLKKWEKMSDTKRWEWVIKNQDSGITVFLDNDSTFVADACDETLHFDDHLGWDRGVFTLLDVLGVRASCV